jgi:DNA polymerase I-like protein with 3'-5' exonuclease and polymerase domains
VLTVDFTSIEPRVALLSVGKLAPEDVYSDILEEFQGIGRQTAKAVTLIALYGGQVNRLSGVVGDTEKARKAVSFVRSHFRVNELEAKLSRQAELGLVRNIFGRPLREATKNARVRTNHYLQSSAAELAPTLFSELCQKFSHGVRPLFVIHDALVVDVAADVEHEFRQQAVTIAWDGSRFPVKIEKLDHT